KIGKNKVHNELKPYVDAVSSEVTKEKLVPPKSRAPVPEKTVWPPEHAILQSNIPKHEAIKLLQKQVQSFTEKELPVRSFIKCVRLFPYYSQYRKDLYTISSWQGKDG